MIRVRHPEISWFIRNSNCLQVVVGRVSLPHHRPSPPLLFRTDYYYYYFIDPMSPSVAVMANTVLAIVFPAEYRLPRRVPVTENGRRIWCGGTWTAAVVTETRTVSRCAPGGLEMIKRFLYDYVRFNNRRSRIYHAIIKQNICKRIMSHDWLRAKKKRRKDNLDSS